MTVTKWILALAVASAVSLTADAGTYTQVDRQSSQHPSDSEYVQPFAIVHPPGYTGGTPDVVPVSICVRPEDPQLVPAVQMAIDIWNRLEPTTDNCQGCVLWEEPLPPDGPIHAFSVVLHEMGHCALGLGHPDLTEANRDPIETATGTCDVDEDDVCQEPTSFTNSGNATQIISASGVRGSSDNDHQNSCPFIDDTTRNESGDDDPRSGEDIAARETACARLAACPTPPDCCPRCPGEDCPTLPLETIDFSWYRLADNNPFVIDSVVIDRTTFSRRRDLLPAGHNYAANANRGLADSLGVTNTQSVMYSGFDPGARYSGLTADDVNMVKMGMTGVDRDAGTADDYTIALVYQTNCTISDIVVGLTDMYVQNLGICSGIIEKSFSNSVHYSQAPNPLDSQLFIELDPNENWDFDVPLIFRGSFETGDLSEWSNSSQSL